MYSEIGNRPSALRGARRFLYSRSDNMTLFHNIMFIKMYKQTFILMNANLDDIMTTEEKKAAINGQTSDEIGQISAAARVCSFNNCKRKM